MIDQLLFNLDNDKVTGLVLSIADKKAFDLIDHHLVLLSKLKMLGVNENFLPLFCDNLSGRLYHKTQFTISFI